MAHENSSPVDEAKVAEQCAAMLERLRTSTQPWLTESKLRGKKTALSDAALEKLTADGLIGSLGKVGRSTTYALIPAGMDAAALLRQLAANHLEELSRTNGAATKLKPLPMSGVTDPKKVSKQLPTSVRSAVAPAFKDWMSRSLVFTLKVGNTNCFLFRSNLEQVVGMKSAEVTPAVAASSEDIHRIREAYGRLVERTRLRNVLIAELQAESGVSRETLHRYLNDERRSKRANATRGEVTASSEAELAAALQIEGRPYVYIELYATE